MLEHVSAYWPVYLAAFIAIVTGAAAVLVACINTNSQQKMQKIELYYNTRLNAYNDLFDIVAKLQSLVIIDPKNIKIDQSALTAQLIHKIYMVSILSPKHISDAADEILIMNTSSKNNNYSGYDMKKMNKLLQLIREDLYLTKH
ncbi:MAG: hypothetical protein LBK69_02600 [Syntrophomonadaceae bacterium]|nr:hypothetical protein [Syntrophomonadaceae bacterium]